MNKTRIPRTPADHIAMFGGASSSMDADVVASDRSLREDREFEAAAEQAVEPVRTAMVLMASGFAGEALQSEMELRHSTEDLLTADTELRAVRAKFEGLNGRVVHDPSWYVNCKKAASALRANKQQDTGLVVLRMAKCSSCSLRTVGKCTLMKRPLVANLERHLSGQVEKRISRAAAQGEISENVAMRISAADRTATRKMQAFQRVKKGQGQVVQASAEKDDGKALRSIAASRTRMERATTPKKRSRRRVASVQRSDFNSGTDIATAPRTRVAKSKKAKTVVSRSQRWGTKVTRYLATRSTTHEYWRSREARDLAGSHLEEFQSLAEHGVRFGAKEEQLRQALEGIISSAVD